MEKNMQEESEITEPTGLPVALLVDLQPAFLEVVADGEALLANCRLFLEAARLLGLPVQLTEQVPDKLGGTDERLASIAPDLRPLPKTGFSAFSAPSLSEALQDSDASHLLLAGVETSICVYYTALDALNEGMDVTILTDCVSCRRTQDGEWALRKLAAAGCHLLPLETIFYGILGSSDHPLFKPFTKLVRERNSH